MNRESPNPRTPPVIGDRDPAPGLASYYLRAFTRCLDRLRQGEDPDLTLAEILSEDPFLDARWVLPDGPQASLSPFAGDPPGAMVFPLPSVEAADGHLAIPGRRDGALLAADDLHLMGALAGFIASLLSASRISRRAKERMDFIQFMLDEIPVGIIGSDRTGRELIANRQARLLLDLPDDAKNPRNTAWGNFNTRAGNHERFHIEIRNRLLFVESRFYRPSPDAPGVRAFILFDLTPERARFFHQMEGMLLWGNTPSPPDFLALLSLPGDPGSGLRSLRADPFPSAPGIEVNIQALDAHTTGILLTGAPPPLARRLLRKRLLPLALAGGQGPRLAWTTGAGLPDQAPGELIARMTKDLRPLEQSLRPHLLLIQHYPPAAKAIRMALEDDFEIESTTATTPAGIESIDGVILDGDDAGTREALLPSLRECGIPLCFVSSLPESIARTTWSLATGDLVLQKPFDAKVIRDRFRNSLQSS